MPVDETEIQSAATRLGIIRQNHEDRKRRKKRRLKEITPETVKSHRLMMDVATAYVLTPKKATRIIHAIADIALGYQDIDGQQVPLGDPQAQIAAAKFLWERVLGKPKQYIETNGTQTLTLEQRTMIVNRFFGIEPGDESLLSGHEEVRRLEPSPDKRLAALPAQVLDRYEPKEVVEEESANRGDICERPQERSEAGAADEGDGPDRPPVQQ